MPVYWLQRLGLYHLQHSKKYIEKGGKAACSLVHWVKQVWGRENHDSGQLVNWNYVQIILTDQKCKKRPWATKKPWWPKIGQRWTKWYKIIISLQFIALHAYIIKGRLMYRCRHLSVERITTAQSQLDAVIDILSSLNTLGVSLNECPNLKGICLFRVSKYFDLTKLGIFIFSCLINMWKSRWWWLTRHGGD